MKHLLVRQRIFVAKKRGTRVERRSVRPCRFPFSQSAVWPEVTHGKRDTAPDPRSLREMGVTAESSAG